MLHRGYKDYGGQVEALLLGSFLIMQLAQVKVVVKVNFSPPKRSIRFPSIRKCCCHGQHRPSFAMLVRRALAVDVQDTALHRRKK